MQKTYNVYFELVGWMVFVLPARKLFLREINPYLHKIRRNYGKLQMVYECDMCSNPASPVYHLWQHNYFGLKIYIYVLINHNIIIIKNI